MGNVADTFEKIGDDIVDAAEGVGSGVASAGLYVAGAGAHVVGQGDAGNELFEAGKEAGEVFVEKAPVVSNINNVVTAFTDDDVDNSDIDALIAAYIADEKEEQSDDNDLPEDEKNEDTLMSLNTMNDEMRKQVQGCVDELSVAEQDVAAILQATEADQVISICDKMETWMRSMEQQAAAIAEGFNTKKSELMTLMQENREAYANQTSAIQKKTEEIKEEESELTAKEEYLKGQKAQIKDLAEEMKRHRRALKEEKKKAALENLATPPGFRWIAEEDVNRVERQIHSKIDEITAKRDSIQTTRSHRRELKREVSRMKHELSRLESEKERLSQVQTQMGQQLVVVSNASKDLQEAAMKCKQIRNKVETVSELTSAGLMEIIADPVNELTSNIQGAKKNFSLCC